MLAAFNGQADALNQLLDAGANPNAQTRTGTSPLMLAVHGGQHECTRILLERGAKPSLATLEGYQPLHEAVARGDEIATQLLLKAGADPNAFDHRGRTALHEAARLGHPGILRLLLETGAEPELRSLDDLSWTAWCFAKQAGHGAVLLELARTGIKPAPGSSKLPMQRRKGLSFLIRKFLVGRSDLRVIDGMVVRVLPKAGRDRTRQRVGEALQLLHRYDPKRMLQIQRHLSFIWVPGWHFAYGAYDVDFHSCILASSYVLSPNNSAAAIAGTIVHEATHARLWKQQYETSAFVRARTERLWYQAQRDFLSKVPGTSELVRLIHEEGRADPITWSTAALTRATAELLKQERLPRWLARMAGRAPGVSEHH